MSLLYRVGDEICIEMSRDAWERVEGAIEDNLAYYNDNGWSYPGLNIELSNFASAIRSHLQHLEADKPTPPPSNNLDLI